jgi:hypothetical protein
MRTAISGVVRFVSEHASKGASLVAAVGFIAVPAGAQVFTQNYNVQHNFSLSSAAPNMRWGTVEAKAFVHAWSRFTPNYGGTSVAAYRPGQYPSDLPMQPAGFAPLGYDAIWNGQPVNVCPWGLCNPPRSVVPSLKTTAVSFGGLPFQRIFVDLPTLARASAYSDISVNPYNNSTPITGTIRSFGTWQQVPIGSSGGAYSRSFAYSEVKATRVANGIVSPGSPISSIFWQPAIQFYLGVPRPWWAQPTAPSVLPLTLRAYDPVTYEATDLVTGQVASGEMLRINVDLSDGGVGYEEGVLTVDSQNAYFEIVLDDPRVEPRGSLRVRVVDGVVQESWADGFLAPFAVPEGQVTPFTALMPSDFNMVLDLTGFTSNDMEIAITMDGGGAGQREINNPPVICVADVDDGSGWGIPDGGVTIDDLIYYLQIFESGDERADIDDGSGTGSPDGGVTIDDLLYYLQRFEAGC